MNQINIKVNQIIYNSILKSRINKFLFENLFSKFFLFENTDLNLFFM